MSDEPAPRSCARPPGFDEDRCAAYLEGNAGAPPRELLLRAIPLVAGHEPRRALDVGCGPGRETVALLHAGFEVHAFDPYPTMIERTRALVEAECGARASQVRLELATLEEIAEALPASAFALVHAGFVLPFVLPSRFDACFDALRSSLVPGGVLVAQFFGPDDEFIRTAAPGTMTGHDARELDSLLAGLDIVHREEVNRAGKVGRGREKWWHVHHVIARAGA